MKEMLRKQIAELRARRDELKDAQDDNYAQIVAAQNMLLKILEAEHAQRLAKSMPTPTSGLT